MSTKYPHVSPSTLPEWRTRLGVPISANELRDAYDFLDSRLPQPLDCDENAVTNPSEDDKCCSCLLSAHILFIRNLLLRVIWGIFFSCVCFRVWNNACSFFYWKNTFFQKNEIDNFMSFICTFFSFRTLSIRYRRIIYGKYASPHRTFLFTHIFIRLRQLAFSLILL